MALKFNPAHRPELKLREPFSSPKPREGEQLSAYVVRIAEAFEQWVNGQTSQSPPPNSIVSRDDTAVEALRTQGWDGGHPLNAYDDAERIVAIVRAAMEASNGR